LPDTAAVQSEAGDEAIAGSDIDVLVDYGPGARLSHVRVFALQERFEDSGTPRTLLQTSCGERLLVRRLAACAAAGAG
jgi:hypothetical protein